MSCAYQRIVDDITQPFTPALFAEPRLPIKVGAIDIAQIGYLPSCLDMLVKMPDGEITLPPPYRGNPIIAKAFDLISATQDKILPRWRLDRYLYLTVDQRFVRPGSTHRNAGWHFDGMQGSRYPIKLPACHQYVASSDNPTEFLDTPVDAVDLDENEHNWFEIIGERAAAKSSGRSFRPAVGDLMLMSAYQVHRSPPATNAGWRTFLRIDVSLKQQDRLGNTENPALPAPWDYVPRHLPAGLQTTI